MQIIKFVAIVKNIFGRISRNIYYPKTNEEYWNFVQNMIDNVPCFFIESIDDSYLMEEISVGFSGKECIHFMCEKGVLNV